MNFVVLCEGPGRWFIIDKSSYRVLAACTTMEAAYAALRLFRDA